MAPPRVVAPAARSEAALAKDQDKQTADGYPVESFQSLLRNLATIVRNVMRPKGQPGAEFALVTVPTPLKQRALDLLGAPASL